MKHQNWFYFFLLFLSFLFFLSRGYSEEFIKIATVGPLTGSQAKVGMDMRNGAALAIEEANAKGGVLGKKVLLLSMDDKADPREAVAIAQRLVADPGVLAVVGHLNSGCSIPASKIYHEGNLVMITPSSTHPVLTLQGFPEVFRVCVPDNVQGSFAGEFVIKKLNRRKIAIIHDRTQYGQGLAEEFRKAILSLGGEVLAFEGITQGDKDFTAVLTKIKAKKPEAIYFGGMYPEGGLLVKQGKELGINVPFISGDGLYDPEFLKIAQKHAEGCYVTFLAPPWEKIERAKEFVEKYQKNYGDVGPYSPFAYDATRIILDAIKRAGTFNRKEIVKEVRKTRDFPGVTGTINFDANGDNLNRSMYVYVVKGGKFELYK